MPVMRPATLGEMKTLVMILEQHLPDTEYEILNCNQNYFLSSQYGQVTGAVSGLYMMDTRSEDFEVLNELGLLSDRIIIVNKLINWRFCRI